MTPADLLPQVYQELRKLAQVKLAGENPGHTLDATALVHEVYLKLAPRDSRGAQWKDERHFFAAAATAMRRILVDHARAKLTDKRGGAVKRVELGDVAASAPDEQLLELHAALNKLAESKPDHAQIIELRYFGGLTGDEAAEALGLSPATADRMFRFARAWLQVEMND